MLVFVCVCFFCVCACASRTGVLELLRVHAVSPADSEMDVRFFPAPPSSVGSCTLPADSGLDYYHSNKVTMLSLLVIFFFLLVCLFVLIFLHYRRARRHKLLKHKRLPSGDDAATTRCTFRHLLGGNRGAVNSSAFGSSSLENKHLLRARAHAIIPFNRAECGWGRRRHKKSRGQHRSCTAS